MRDVTKSMIRFSMAMTLFGAKQVANLVSKSSANESVHPATAAFDAVSGAAEQNLDDVYRSAYRAGDHFQRGVVDTVSTLINKNPRESIQYVRAATENLRKSAESAVDAMKSGASSGRSAGMSEPGSEPAGA